MAELREYVWKDMTSTFTQHAQQSLRKITFEYSEDFTTLIRPPHKVSINLGINFNARNINIAEETARRLDEIFMGLPKLEMVKWSLRTVDGPVSFGLHDQDRLRALFPSLRTKGILKL